MLPNPVCFNNSEKRFELTTVLLLTACPSWNPCFPNISKINTRTMQGNFRPVELLYLYIPTIHRNATFFFRGANLAWWPDLLGITSYLLTPLWKAETSKSTANPQVVDYQCLEKKNAAARQCGLGTEMVCLPLRAGWVCGRYWGQCLDQPNTITEVQQPAI